MGTKSDVLDAMNHELPRRRFLTAVAGGGIAVTGWSASATGVAQAGAADTNGRRHVAAGAT